MLALLFGAFLGLLVGLRHAFEPDHLAAVSTLVTRTRSTTSAARLGAAWGLGHTTALVVVCGALIVSGISVPPRYESAFELGVGLMLIGLGARGVWLAWRSSSNEPAAHVHLGGATLAWRPFVVGLIHGLAGSGAVTAAVMVDLRSNAARISYIALFGIGSVAGMALSSALFGGALARLGQGERVRRGVSVTTGVFAFGVGIFWSATAIAGT